MHPSLDLFSHARVALIGDLMLDCYLYGDVHRISPEAPVPVVRARREESVPGGAANVAANLAAMDVHVQLVGVTGQDAGHDELLQCIGVVGNIDCSGIVSAGSRRTTKKLRIIGAQQQIVRIDHEDFTPHDAELEGAAIGAIKGVAAVVVITEQTASDVIDTLHPYMSVERSNAR